MIHTLADEFAAEVAKLCAIEVTDRPVEPLPRRLRPDRRPGDRQGAGGARQDTGRDQTPEAAGPLPQRSPGRPLARNRARGPSSGQHLRRARVHHPRDQPGRTQPAEDHHRGLRAARPGNLEHVEGSPDRVRTKACPGNGASSCRTGPHPNRDQVPVPHIIRTMEVIASDIGKPSPPPLRLPVGCGQRRPTCGRLLVARPRLRFSDCFRPLLQQGGTSGLTFDRGGR